MQTKEPDISRGALILKGALAAAAVYRATMLEPFLGRALGATGGGDVGLLNYMLTLEYLELSLYTEAKRRAGASGELGRLIDLIAADEDEHVEALTSMIEQMGAKPSVESEFNFHYRSAEQFLGLAQTIEEAGISAYVGAAPELRSKDALALAASIAQVEARHAAAIRLQNGREPTPMAFDFSEGEAAVRKSIKPFVELK